MGKPAVLCKCVLAWLLVLFTSHTPAQVAPRTVLVFGDSLSAAYNLSVEQGWVALLGKKLEAEKPGWRVVNASVSGETTAGGKARIARAIAEHSPAVVVLELGANDALRGLPLDQAQANLQAIIDAARAANARVLLVGVEMPPNYGPDYADAFRAMFAALAKQNETALLPFLLEPIATDLSWFQPDTIHPTAAAQPKVMEHVWPALESLLE
ncbi:MAG: arylesterase [Lysobacteraceae bacterium]